MELQPGILLVLFLPLILQAGFSFSRLPKLLYLIPGALAFIGLLVLATQPDESLKGIEVSWFLIAGSSSWKVLLSLQGDRALFACLAAGFSFLIQWYSTAYLRPTDSQAYFHFLIRVFQTAMAWLFLSENFFSLFLGWEWVGLTSYLLVQFWFGSEDPVRSGLRVLLINKLGDVFLLAGLGALVSFGLHHSVFSSGGFPPGAEVFFQSKTGGTLLLFLLLAAMVKSAQFPFSVWLKEAMQGPTSVSALLHSATMVLAGIWVISRLEPVLSPELHGFLLAIGFLTFFLAAFGALLASKIKELLAFSTISQLALMLVAIGSGKPQLALFHGFTHAFFKAALFLFAGWLIHEMERRRPYENPQSIHLWKGILAGSFWRWPFLFCLMALSGMPLTAGFISKESFLPDVWSGSVTLADGLIYAGFQIGGFLTSLYSFRLFFWLSSPSGGAFPLEKPAFSMRIPMLLLSLGSGFWLVGLNPFSSSGWVQSLLRFDGHSLHPDVWAAVLGALLAWRWMSKGQATNWLGTEAAWQRALRWEFFPNLASRLGGYGIALSKGFLRFEQRAMDAPPRRMADGFLVAGYFAGFLDRWVLDPILHLLVSFVFSLGEIVKESTRKYPQYVVWFAMTFLFVLIYFVYRS
jgi:NADH-quinone oxidoreductase subunit L